MALKPTGARYKRLTKHLPEKITVQQLRESRLITAKQASAAHGGVDARLTDTKELWVTVGKTRMLIDRGGVVVQTYKK